MIARNAIELFHRLPYDDEVSFAVDGDQSTCLWLAKNGLVSHATGVDRLQVPHWEVREAADTISALHQAIDAAWLKIEQQALLLLDAAAEMSPPLKASTVEEAVRVAKEFFSKLFGDAKPSIRYLACEDSILAVYQSVRGHLLHTVHVVPTVSNVPNLNFLLDHGMAVLDHRVIVRCRIVA